MDCCDVLATPKRANATSVCSFRLIPKHTVNLLWNEATGIGTIYLIPFHQNIFVYLKALNIVVFKPFFIIR